MSVKNIISKFRTNHPLFKAVNVNTKLDTLKIFKLEERFFDSWNKANFFLIKGPDKDLLVDSGECQPILGWEKAGI